MVCLLAMALALAAVFPAFAASVPRRDTPDYKVAFYAFDCYNMQDEDGCCPSDDLYRTEAGE